MTTTPLARSSLALLTDLYQLTMACAYWKSGTHEKEAVFNLFFRQHPFQGGFTVACGLQAVMEWVQQFQFASTDLEYLAGVTGSDDKPLFERAFLDFLSGLRLTCDVDAVPEGTVVFPHEPLVRVQGPILQGQLLETPLLNLVNFPTLIATKAARMCLAARGDAVVEFGLRRAQGVDGALTASRAAYLGGCAATSNVLAGKLFGIPVRGTHAHSWVMSFGDERESFETYARAMPNNTILLVDTYDTLAGVHKAVAVGQALRRQGHDLAGIRLDSGDLAYLSIEARKILDAAGFTQAVIVGSNDLDEHLITSLKQQGATISVWGVGTKLATAYDQPALGGVYKLSAVSAAADRPSSALPGGSAPAAWDYKVKLSEQTIKVNNPGIQQVRRFRSENEFIADAIYDTQLGAADKLTLVDPIDPTRRKHIPAGTLYEDLLVPIFRQGKLVYQTPPLAESRRRTREQLGCFHAGIKRFENPHQYPVGLELQLHELKTRLVLKARSEK
jgi:nicotinate phosphoribosyltransferase